MLKEMTREAIINYANELLSTLQQKQLTERDSTKVLLMAINLISYPSQSEQHDDSSRLE